MMRQIYFMEIKCSHSELVDLDLLQPNPRNPNKHPEEQIKLLAKIMKHQGWRSPVVVSRRSGFIVKGHGRLMAARLNQWTQIPVDRQDYASEADEYADMVADNKIAELSETDIAQVNSDALDLLPDDFDLDLLGIPDFKLVETETLDPSVDPDEMPGKVEAKAKLGDIYRLGRHRLMCGDSTQIDQLEKLMGGEKADLWLTDPPYGVSYKSNGAEDKHLEIANDSKPLKEMYDFWKLSASNAYLVCKDTAPYYWFACQGGDQMMMMMMSISDAGWKVRHELIWKKNQLVLSRCDYHYIHEPILYGWKDGGTHKWFSDRKQTSVLEFDKPRSSDDHSTMKPVGLIEYLISNSSDTGGIVLDTFNGSGTCLIASETQNRVYRGMEIEPIYVDRTIARWERITGKKAELLNG